MNIRTLIFQRSKTEVREIDWEAIYRDQLPCVYNYFCYRLGNEQLAEDLTAATFERAWRKRNFYRDDLGAFSTWLFRIAQNLTVDYYRKTTTEMPLDEGVVYVAAQPSIEEEIERKQTFAYLRTLLDELSGREQELVALKYGAGHTNRQIARLTGLSETNVGSILHRVVKKLRDQWENFE